MSRRKLANLIKRKILLNFKSFNPYRIKPKDQWAEKEIRDFSRLGGDLVVMSMGS